MTERLKDFVPMPRQIASDFKNGRLPRNEMILLWWLRNNATPYGIASANLSAIRSDIFKEVSENYINKLLLSLRSKKYLYYHNRQGRRGSFEVHFGDWMLPNGQVKTLDPFFKTNQVTSETPPISNIQPEVVPSLQSRSQKLDEMKKQLTQKLSYSGEVARVRSPYNDTDKENELNNDISLEKPNNKEIPVRGFQPQSYEQQQCLNIARELGEENMNFLLGALRKHGIQTIERAWGLYKEQRQLTKVDDPPRYFNGIIKNLTVINSQKNDAVL